MNGFLLRSFVAALAVLCLPVTTSDAQGALVGLGTDVLPEDLAHLPGDAGIGTSGVLIRRGNGLAPLPTSQAATSARGGLIAGTSKGVSVNDLPSFTTVVKRRNASVQRIYFLRKPWSASRRTGASRHYGCRAKARGRRSARSSGHHFRMCRCTVPLHSDFARRSCEPRRSGIYLRRQR